MKTDYYKEYYKNNREKIIEKSSNYYKNHKEERKIKMHEYYLKTKDLYTPREKVILTEEELRQHIALVAKNFGFEFTHNKDKIISAKLRMCKEDFKLCPCDHRLESKRWCGSKLCVKECKKYGSCHCNFFCLKGGKTDE